MENYVLITGGSSGLGKELLLQCAVRGFNTILLALPGCGAESLARHVRAEYGVEVVVFELDMTDPAALSGCIRHIADAYPVFMLINNAGTGGTAAITESSPEYIDRIIQLNVRATAMVTRMLLPHLLLRKRAYVMNVASMAAFTPIAYKTVYPASKAFVSSFSLGLHEELRGTAVSVSVVYPGAIMTNSNVADRIAGLGAKARIGLMPVSGIARTALDGTLAGKTVIIPGVWNRILHRMIQLMPVELRLRLLSGTVRRELKLQTSDYA